MTFAICDCEQARSLAQRLPRVGAGIDGAPHLPCLRAVQAHVHPLMCVVSEVSQPHQTPGCATCVSSTLLRCFARKPRVDCLATAHVRI